MYTTHWPREDEDPGSYPHVAFVEAKAGATLTLRYFFRPAQVVARNKRERKKYERKKERKKKERKREGERRRKKNIKPSQLGDQSIPVADATGSPTEHATYHPT